VRHNRVKMVHVCKYSMDKSTGSGKFNIANEFEINHFDKAGVPMCIDYVIAKSLPPFTSSLCV
jgi:hypothetical protein